MPSLVEKIVYSFWYLKFVFMTINSALSLKLRLNLRWKFSFNLIQFLINNYSDSIQRTRNHDNSNILEILDFEETTNVKNETWKSVASIYFIPLFFCLFLPILFMSFEYFRYYVYTEKKSKAEKHRVSDDRFRC